MWHICCIFRKMCIFNWSAGTSDNFVRIPKSSTYCIAALLTTLLLISTYYIIKYTWSCHSTRSFRRSFCWSTWYTVTLERRRQARLRWRIRQLPSWQFHTGSSDLHRGILEDHRSHPARCICINPMWLHFSRYTYIMLGNRFSNRIMNTDQASSASHLLIKRKWMILWPCSYSWR